MKKLIDKYLDEMDVTGALSKATIANRRYNLISFEKYLSENDINLYSLSKDGIVGYLATLDIKPVTKYHVIDIIKAFLQYLKENKIIAENFAKKIRKPRLSSTDVDYLEFSEVKKLLLSEEKKCGKKLVERNLLLMNLFFTLCLRSSEVCNLTFRDVRLDLRQVWIKRKGGDIAKLPLNDELIRLFRNWFKKRLLFNNASDPNNDYIFLSTTGAKLKPRQAGYVVRRALRREGFVINKSGPHMLRHSGATFRLQRGENITVIQKFLGHTSLSITEKYLHHSQREMVELVERSPEIMSKEPDHLTNKIYYKK